MGDFKEFKDKLERSGRKVIDDESIRKKTDIWNYYVKSLISSFGDSIQLDPANVEIVVVEEENLKCNAFVQKVGKTYFIAINKYILRFYQDRIQDVFLKNDNYIRLKLFSEETKSVADMNELFFKIGGPYYSFFNSPDLKYNIFANIVYNNILYLIIFHEFGHIITGQLENKDSQNAFFELRNQSLGNLEDQGKEFLADYYGTINTLRTAICFNTLDLKKFTTVIGLLKFSVWCMLSFFTIGFTEYDLELDFKNYLEKNSRFKHPPISVRLYYIHLMIDSEVPFHLNKTFRPDWYQRVGSNAKKRLIYAIQSHSQRIMMELIGREYLEKDVALRYGEDVLNSLTVEYYYEVRKYASLISKKLQTKSFVKFTVEEEITESEQVELKKLKEFEKMSKLQDEALLYSYIEKIDEEFSQELIELLSEIIN